MPVDKKGQAPRLVLQGWLDNPPDIAKESQKKQKLLAEPGRLRPKDCGPIRCRWFRLPHSESGQRSRQMPSPAASKTGSDLASTKTASLSGKS
jgi:hypothetical protein